MGRKRNQGKARRAAKAAKARGEAERRGDAANSSGGQPLSEQLRHLRADAACKHGYDPPVSRDNNVSIQFVYALGKSLDEAIGCGDRSLSECFAAAVNATWDKFADVWNDSATMEMAMSCCLFVGTQHLIEGNDNSARKCATFARYLEQHIAVELKQTQALINWPKVESIYYYGDDLHTLVKFLRHRIPCSCLDEKYEEVKSITKMGFCYNRKCKFSFLGGGMERSRAKYCSRCRDATYCSRECQEANWSWHKTGCDRNAAIIAEFEAKQKNM